MTPSKITNANIIIIIMNNDDTESNELLLKSAMVLELEVADVTLEVDFSVEATVKPSVLSVEATVKPSVLSVELAGVLIYLSLDLSDDDDDNICFIELQIVSDVECFDETVVLVAVVLVV